MVALKLHHPHGPGDALHGKQERRGGIETVVVEEEVPRVVTEAGTPWWH